jgi:DNA-binding protein H-NS
MGFADKLNQLTKKAKDAAVEHKDQVEQAVEKAAVAADQRTGGKYHDQLANAEAKADAYLEDQAQRSSPTTPSTTSRPQPEDEPRANPGGRP